LQFGGAVDRLLVLVFSRDEAGVNLQIPLQAVTSFHAEKSCHLVRANAASAWRFMQQRLTIPDP